MKAYVFPGQGAQFVGMGKSLYQSSEKAQKMFQQANDILGFDIADIMFDGSQEDLRQTKVTQPAIFIHSVVIAMTMEDFKPAMAAGHSLGEFSALCAAQVLGFEDALRLVSVRAKAMQQACEASQSGMAAVLGLKDEIIEQVCASIEEEIIVAANYNCDGQVVISGSEEGIRIASEKLLAQGAKRCLKLNVGGAFHSPLMLPAQKELADAINKAQFRPPICPIYQNVDAQPHVKVEEIKKNLIEQLIMPVRWSQIMERMAMDGADEFVELGPGNVLQGLIKKSIKNAAVSGIQ